MKECRWLHEDDMPMLFEDGVTMIYDGCVVDQPLRTVTVASESPRTVRVGAESNTLEADNG